MVNKRNRTPERRAEHSNRSLVNLLLVAVVFSIALGGCRFSCSDGFGPAAIGNGEIKTVKQDLGAFDEVEFDGIGTMEIVHGAKHTITITADENLIELIGVDVNSNRLRVRVKKPTISKNGITINVTTPKIKAVDSQGAASVTVSSIDSESFSATQSGVGSMSLQGKTTSLNIDLSGAGRINAKELEARKVDATVSGVGTVKVNAIEHLKAHVSGAGSVVYSGDPKVDSHVSGVGSVHK